MVMQSKIIMYTIIQGRHLGGGRGCICPTLILKIVTFWCFCLQNFVFSLFAPPRKLVKILPPPLGKNWNDVPATSVVRFSVQTFMDTTVINSHLVCSTLYVVYLSFLNETGLSTLVFINTSFISLMLNLSHELHDISSSLSYHYIRQYWCQC